MNFEAAKADSDETDSEREITINKALAQIQAILSQIHAMGRNDSERPTIDEIMRQVQEGQISPAEGVQRATEVLDQKQEY